MEPLFKNIALSGLPRDPAGLTTHRLLYHWLTGLGYSLLVEQELACVLNLKQATIASLADIGQHSDLVVIVGGDGNMLSAARMLACHNIAIIGVNRGNLGFLTDLDPEHLQQQLAPILAGNYITEYRFLLEAQVCDSHYPQYQAKQQSLAVNEVVLHPGQIAQMIEFEVYIDEQFAFAQRADGVIIATPTGSTAYSLSGGGPILTPTLNAMLLISMFPHSLSSRPLVIDSNSIIRLHFSTTHPLQLCCDGHINLPLQKGDSILVRKSAHRLRLIHPESYDYFNRLSAKLGWLKKLF